MLRGLGRDAPRPPRPAAALASCARARARRRAAHRGHRAHRRGRHRGARPLPRDQRLRGRHRRRRRRGGATARGIVVANVPDYCAIDVAEHTIALILAAWRRLPRRRARGPQRPLGPRRPAAAAPAHRPHAGAARLRPHRPRGRRAGAGARAAGARPRPLRRGGRGVRRRAAVAAATSCCARATSSPSTCRATPETAGSVDAAALALLPRGAVAGQRGARRDRRRGRAARRAARAAASAPPRLDVLRREPAAGRPSAAGAGERRLHAAHGVLLRGVAARAAPRRRHERAHRARGWRAGPAVNAEALGHAAVRAR